MAIDIINNIRIIEDSVGFILLTIALFYLVYASYKMIKSPMRYIPISLTIGLIPLYIWKFAGAAKRAFVDKTTSPALYGFLDTFGETMEALSGLILALVFIYILLRLKGVIGAKKEEQKPAETPKVEPTAEIKKEEVVEEKSSEKKSKSKK